MRILDFLRKLGGQSEQPKAPNETGDERQTAPLRTDSQDPGTDLRRADLFFREGNSDKVYHLEMEETGEGLYVVNFRYGRRDTRLQTGTKTPRPVPLAEAEKIFAALLAEKTKKGYQPFEPEAGPVRLSFGKKDTAARARAIVGHLTLALRSPQAQVKKNWDIRRVMWRAGELRLVEALPHVVALLEKGAPKGDALWRYCALWAIGRCAQGAAAAELEAAREVLRREVKTSSDLLTINALLQVTTGEERAAALELLVLMLPPSFQHNVRQNDGAGALLTLRDYVENRPKSNFAFVGALHLLALERPALRPAVQWFAEHAPFVPGFFKVLRGLFKMAELRDDAPVLGVLARRFSLETAYFKRNPLEETLYLFLDGNSTALKVREELQKPDSRLAFSNRTRAFFQRRVLRHLLGALEHRDDTYVRLAVGILLAQRDEATDKAAAHSTTIYTRYDQKAQKWETQTTLFPAFSSYPAFFYILNGGCEHFKLSKDGASWSIDKNHADKVNAERKRLEAHPERWDACPQAYVHLLAESELDLVLEFALRNLKKHPDLEALTARFDGRLIRMLLRKKHNLTVAFALALAEKMFDPENPDRELVLDMLENSHASVRQKAHNWFRANLRAFVRDTEFVYRLLTHPAADLRQNTREAMFEIAQLLDADQQKVLIGRLVARLLALEPLPENVAPGQFADEICAALVGDWAAPHLTEIHLNVLLQLLKSTEKPVQNFGIQLLTLRERKAGQIFLTDSLLQTLLASPADNLRSEGLSRLFRLAPGAQRDTVLAFSELFASPHADVRTGMRGAAIGLLGGSADFDQRLLGICLKLLQRKENPAGLHEEVLDFALQNLAETFKGLERKAIFRLLNSPQIAANRLAAHLINMYVSAESLSVRNIVRLGNHEALAVRETCRRMFLENVARMRYEREDALLLLDSDWDDTRAFAFDFFRGNFTERDWTPELLTGVCDSVRPDVQAFGCEMIERFFREEDGPEYLLRLSQHPRQEMRDFAARYLDRFAADNPERLEKLEFYFVTVLSQVNKSRAARDLVFDFLEKESRKSERAARLVAGILDRISLTSVVADRERCVAILHEIGPSSG